jgi:hypothetical protein
MKFGNLITAAALAALSFTASAATLVVPAAGAGPGANDTQWQSELTLHNVAPRAVTLTLTFHRGSDVFGPVPIALQPRQTRSIADVVRTQFGLDSATGAIVIDVADRDAKSVAVTSRTFNVSADREFGQDIPAIDVANAARAGDVAVLAAPSNASSTRYNFGLYAIEATNVEWQLLRADGTVAATKALAYAAGQHVQYNGGVAQLFAAPAQNNDTLHARVTAGKAIFYGSAVNNITGDPTYVPGVRTREEVLITFAGVDLDENGTADVVDADGDGVLDSPLVIAASLFPSYFNLIARGEFGEAVQFEVVSSPAEATLLDPDTLRVSAGGEVKGKTGEIRVRATTGTSSSIFTIPVRFQ